MDCPFFSIIIIIALYCTVLIGIDEVLEYEVLVLVMMMMLCGRRTGGRWVDHSITNTCGMQTVSDRILRHDTNVPDSSVHINQYV